MGNTTARELTDGYSRLFGGDAAKQRAEDYRNKKGFGRVFAIGSKEAPPSAYGLDPFGRGSDGIVYSYVAVGAPLTAQ